MAEPSTANKTNDIARHTPLRPYERSQYDEHVKEGCTVVVQGCCARPTGDSYGRTA
jgi:hypothetical protein